MEWDVGIYWQLWGLHGNYRVYVAVMGSTWQCLHGVYVAVTGLHGNDYWVYVAVLGLHGCYGSTWCLLEGCHIHPITATYIL